MKCVIGEYEVEVRCEPEALWRWLVQYAPTEPRTSTVPLEHGDYLEFILLTTEDEPVAELGAVLCIPSRGYVGRYRLGYLSYKRRDLKAQGGGECHAPTDD